MRDWTDTVLGPGAAESKEPAFTIKDWHDVRGRMRSDRYDEDWRRAIDAFQRRFTERFVRPVEAILERDTSGIPEGRGFAVLALDCLLLESLYGYRKGRHTKWGSTSEALEKVLLEEPFQKDFGRNDLAARFGRAVRNGILHDGETRDGWIVRKSYRSDAPIVEERDGMTWIYRNEFHRAVTAYITAYFDRLRHDNAEATALRENFKCRVNELCDDSAPPTVAAPPTPLARATNVLATLGLAQVDDALATFPETFAKIAPYEQHVGYKSWKVPGRRANWLQWNDGDVALRINFPDRAGHMRTWKLFARFADGSHPRGPWGRPEQYVRKRAQWMLAGANVWGLTYESLSAFLDRVPELEELLRADVADSYRYSVGPYRDS